MRYAWLLVLVALPAVGFSQKAPVFKGVLRFEEKMGPEHDHRIPPSDFEWHVSPKRIRMMYTGSTAVVTYIYYGSRQAYYDDSLKQAWYVDDYGKRLMSFHNVPDSCASWGFGGEGFIPYADEVSVRLVKGRTKTIQGYACLNYIKDTLVINPITNFQEPVTLEFWVTPELRMPFDSIPATRLTRVPYTLRGVKGLVLEATMRNRDKQMSRVTCTSIEPGSVPDSVFVLPNYPRGVMCGSKAFDKKLRPTQ